MEDDFWFDRRRKEESTDVEASLMGYSAGFKESAEGTIL